jgi:tetratricopeptide (TPR) repeat protein/predicted aspartyl protease
MRSLFAAALLLLASFGALPASAQTVDWRTWERYMENGRRALSQGREAGAENWFSDAAREAERLDPKSPQLAASLKSLADLYRKQGRQREAEALEQRIGAIAPAPGTSVVTALEDYAKLLRQDGRELDAAVLEREIQALRSVSPGSRQGELLFFSPVAELRSYARLLRQRNRVDEARSIEMLASAEARGQMSRYADLRRQLSAESASASSSLTWEWQTQGAMEALEAKLYPEAEGLLADAIKTAETFPPPDVRLAYSLSALAFASRAQGKRAEFGAATQRAMTILESAAGSRHSSLPRGLTILALAHLRFELEPATTIAHFERALVILRKDVAPDNPVVGLHFAGLAAAHLALSQPAQAKPYLEQAFAIADQQYRKDQVPVAIGLMKVVDVYTDLGDYAQAHAVAQRVVVYLTRMRPANHPDIIMATTADRFLVQKLGQAKERVTLASVTTVPIEIAPGNAMLVHARVNRSQGALLLVDTGAGATVIRPLLLERLGMSMPANAPRHRVTIPSGLTIEVPTVTLSVQVGDASVENLEVGVFDVAPQAPDLDGFLGADFLQRFKVTFERAARRMTLEPLK